MEALPPLTPKSICRLSTPSSKGCALDSHPPLVTSQPQQYSVPTPVSTVGGNRVHIGQLYPDRDCSPGAVFAGWRYPPDSDLVAGAAGPGEGVAGTVEGAICVDTTGAVVKIPGKIAVFRVAGHPQVSRQEAQGKAGVFLYSGVCFNRAISDPGRQDELYGDGGNHQPQRDCHHQLDERKTVTAASFRVTVKVPPAHGMNSIRYFCCSAPGGIGFSGFSADLLI